MYIVFYNDITRKMKKIEGLKKVWINEDLIDEERVELEGYAMT